CTLFPLYVQRPLKRKVIVRTHARKTRHARIYGLEVYEPERVLQLIQFRKQLRAEPRFPRLHAGAGTSLNLAQREVIGYVADGLDTHLLQFLHRAGVESWQT